jgi:hypothetical protein
MVQCQAITKKGRRCPTLGATMYAGQFLCHVHHPDGLFQQQQRAKALVKAGKKKKRVVRTDEYYDYLHALRSKMGLPEPSRR